MNVLIFNPNGGKSSIGLGQKMWEKYSIIPV